MTDVAVTALLSYAIFLLVKFLLYLHGLNTIFKDVPGPEKHWFYGNLHLLPEGAEERVQLALKNSQLFPRYYCFWVTLLRPNLVVTSPEVTRAILKTSEPKPTGFAGMYRLGLPWLGEGLLIAGGQKWARSRRLLTPAFHFDILRPYMAVYNDAADLLSENLRRYASSGEKFEVFEYVSKATLDVILRCAFSYVTDCQKENKKEKHPYVKAVEELADAWNYRGRKPWLYPDFIFYLTSRGRKFTKNCDFVHGVAEDIIRKRKEALEKNGQTDRKYLDFLDILLTAKDETGVGLTPLEIRNEVDTFLFEGHDTTASAISWILYSLAQHPECQRKCQQEIDDLLADRDSDDIQWNDLNQLEYMTMCIKEGMRLHSPVPFIQRQFTHDFQIDGKTFPAGTVVSLHIFGLHHNESVWEKPMDYIPERFSKENIGKMDTFQFVPFSAGPRNCIGQHFAMNEEKVLLSKLLRRYWFELDPSHVVRRKVGAVMRTETGIYMYAKQREL